MVYKHNYIKEEEEEEKKEEGFLQKVVQKVKEISFYSYMLSFLIAVLLLILFLGNRNRDLKVPQTVVQTQLVSKEKFSKNEELSMNGTLKLNESNFEVFVSKKVPNRGLILVKSTDFIKNNSNILFYKATKHIIISGNPEIIEKLKLNISNNSNINLKKNSIKIELDSNRQNNSTLKLNINHDVLTKDELVNDETLLTIEYEESYAD